MIQEEDAGPSTSQDWENQEEEEATMSDSTIVVSQDPPCYLCQRTFFFKRILRVVIRECSFSVTVQLIKLDILDGTAMTNAKSTINFLRLSEDQAFYPTQEDFAEVQSPGKSFQKASEEPVVRRPESESRWSCSSRRSSTDPEIIDEHNEGIFDTFIARLAENLELDINSLEDCLDHVMTSHIEVLVEFDYRKLMQLTSQPSEEIECIIINIFWKPKITGDVTPSVDSNSHPESRNSSRSRSRSVAQDHPKHENWFKAVDRGLVVPFHAKRNASIFQSPNTVRDLLRKCIHEIESKMINAFSWYLDKYFYHDFAFPRTTLTYAQYAKCQKVKKIQNPKVIVVEDNPLDLDTHFAYVLALNFYSHHKYVQRYMRDIGLFNESIIRVGKDIPFVIRSLNPVTRMHIFHMVYKESNNSRPSYEHVFRTLVMLRDAMFRLRLKDISMCKIGCCCERLDFGKILKMTEYVFLDTDINVRIGLNLMKCWHFRSRSLRNRNEDSQMTEIYPECVDHFLPDDVPDDVEDNTSDED